MVTNTASESNVLCRSCGAECASHLCAACSDRAVGRIIGGRIRLTRLIGQGGMGAVYEGRHQTLGRRFAVKVLHPRMLENPRSLERFRLEALAAAQVESQHIAAALDLGAEEDGTPFIVMEFLEGQDLAALLAQEKLPPRRAVDIVLQACVGLSAAHAHRLLHRDLKPANVFICATDRGDDLVKILDFGLAKLLDPSGSHLGTTASGGLLGTPAYMSPEQARGEPDLDARTDVYSMGVILYECLSGQRAFQAENFNALLFKVMTTPPAPIGTLCPAVNVRLIEVVETAMHKERTQRYVSIDAFADALAQAASELPHPGSAVGATPWVARHAAPHRAPPVAPRRRGVRWAISVTLAGAIVAAAFPLARRQSTGDAATAPVNPLPSPQSTAAPERVAPVPPPIAVPPREAPEVPSHHSAAAAAAPVPSARAQSSMSRKSTSANRRPTRGGQISATPGSNPYPAAAPPGAPSTKAPDPSAASAERPSGGVRFDRNNPYDSR